MKEVKITWHYDENKDSKKGFEYDLGKYDMLPFVKFTSNKKLNINLNSKLKEFYTEDQEILNALTDKYDLNKSIFSLITSNRHFYQTGRLFLPKVNIVLVWNVVT